MRVGTYHLAIILASIVSNLPFT